MVQSRSRSSFPLHPFKSNWIVSHFFGQEFDCYAAAELQVFGHVDDSHSAPTQQLKDSVMGYFLADKSFGDLYLNNRMSGGRGISFFNRGYKAISTTDDCLHEAWLLGVIFKDLPYFPDRGVDAVIGVKKNVFAPDPFDNLLARDQQAAVL